MPVSLLGSPHPVRTAARLQLGFNPGRRDMHAQISSVARGPCGNAGCRRVSCIAPSRMIRVHAVTPTIGPMPPPSRKQKPNWVRIFEEDADDDPDIAKVLEGTDGDEDKIREKIREELLRKEMISNKEGVEEPPAIVFREVNNFDCWLWFEFYSFPLERERELLEGVMRSWFIIGKLGGFNSQNMQVYHNAASDSSYLEYSMDDVNSAMPSLMHEMGDLDYHGKWARVNLDLGTADEMALDVLLNTLVGFSKDHAAIKRIFVGGENDEWPLPDKDEADRPFDGQAKVHTNPLRVSDMSAELDMLEALEADGDLEALVAAARRPGGPPLDPEQVARQPGMRLYNRDEFRRTFARQGSSTRQADEGDYEDDDEEEQEQGRRGGK